ncbi:BamA/TamA family outer membrane protein [Croceitalea sp. MTPC9]|uniref:BamA/TamA family outer membrane protein n=1 Tax=unclassified Croceitalea TaxID=2632280 RepID=UPI002B3B2D8B|nr:BamA/TamA family outer membrane protein [Croceitalea sp. MTPC6]GMN15337.1 BamA/TamA family outer membrane protein [Croceitalea sp. MTPC9]
MRKVILITVYAVLFLFCLLSHSQNDTTSIKSDLIKDFDLTALPVLFYLPETGLGYGGLGIATFKFKEEPESSRPSSAQFGISYTTKNQLLVFAPYELYWDNEKWRVVGELGFYKYFYNFYGVGINSLEEDFDTYDVTFPRFRFSILREVLPKISLGIGYELDVFSRLRITERGILETSNVIGKDVGGTVSNIGIQAFYDSRDHIFYPTKGFFIQGSVFTAAEFLGSSFSYSKFSLDNRFYQKIKGKQVLATNFFIANNGEGTPFFDFNRLGTNRTRGFNDRRYQDNAELSITTEYRFPISGRFGGAIFASTGTVSPTFSDLFASKYRNAGGIGLRYIINKKDGIRIRVDYGYAAEGGNLYFTIREAF